MSVREPASSWCDCPMLSSSCFSGALFSGVLHPTTGTIPATAREYNHFIIVLLRIRPNSPSARPGRVTAMQRLVQEGASKNPIAAQCQALEFTHTRNRVPCLSSFGGLLNV